MSSDSLAVASILTLTKDVFYGKDVEFGKCRIHVVLVGRDGKDKCITLIGGPDGDMSRIWPMAEKWHEARPLDPLLSLKDWEEVRSEWLSIANLTRYRSVIPADIISPGYPGIHDFSHLQPN